MKSKTVRSEIVHGLRLLLAAWVSLWCVDVAVNLGFLPGAFVGSPMPSRPADFLGLWLTASQLAVGMTVGSLLAGRVAAVVLKSRDATTESVVFLGAGLSAAELLAQSATVWSLGHSDIRLAMLVATVAGFAIWAALRAWVAPGENRTWSGGELLQWTLIPLLLVGYGNLALFHLHGGRLRAAASQLAIVVALLVFRGAARRVRHTAGQLALRWLPAGFVAGLAAYACIGFSYYGTSRPAFAAPGRGDGPDIVLIVLDTVRADRLELYGYGRETMPELTRWARDALVVRRAVSASGWTSPSHASVFSGRPVSLHGVHYARSPSVFLTPPVEGIRWLPAELSAAGYACLAVTANPFAIPSGLDGFRRVLSPKRTNWHISSLTGLVDQFSPLLRPLSERLRWRTPYVDAPAMVEIVRRSAPRGGQPIFLFVNFMDAHSPYNPPRSSLTALGATPGRAFPRYLSHAELTRGWSRLPGSRSDDLADLYDGELRWLDRHLADLLRWIDRTYGEETTIIITSDHGEELGEEGRVGHESGVSQTLIHVPLLVRSPGLPPGFVEPTMNMRRLYEFILSLASEGMADPGTLMRIDPYGIVSERYPRHGFAAQGREDDGRPWVSMIEGEVKAVGPSAFGFRMYDVGSAGFSRQIELDPEGPESDGAGNSKSRVDEYWEEHRDRREEGGSLSDEERKRLRSLGYVN